MFIFFGPEWLSRYSDSLQARRSWGRIPLGGEIFRTNPDRPWGPPSFLYDEYGIFPGVKPPGRGVDHPPFLAPRLKKEYSYTTTPPQDLRGLLYGELYVYFYF